MWLPVATSFTPRSWRSRPMRVRFNLVAEVQADPALPVTLVMAVYKFDRMEWAIEKATELGVAAMAPVIAQRTEKHLAQAAEKRAERWRRIVHEAAQQSRRSDVPLIHNPIPLAERVRDCLERHADCSCRTGTHNNLAPGLEEAVEAAGKRCPRSRSRLDPKADGLRRKKRCSTPTAGARQRWGRAFFAPETAAIAALAVVASFWNSEGWQFPGLIHCGERGFGPSSVIHTDFRFL